MIELKKGQKLFFSNTKTTYIINRIQDQKNIVITREDEFTIGLVISIKYIQEKYNEGIISIVKERKMFNTI